jgi:mono/diheme cytochrome c family protein
MKGYGLPSREVHESGPFANGPGYVGCPQGALVRARWRSEIRTGGAVERVTVLCLAGSVAASAMLVGCNRDGRAAERERGTVSAAPVSAPAPLRESSAVVPTVRIRSRAPSSLQGSAAGGTPALVAHPDHIQAGLVAQRSLAVLVNPREHDPRALEEGKQLFVAYNCGDCHGGDGSGGMGPSLQDGRWHFGGTAGDVYESISEGRPDGMPSWGGRISDAQIWALVTYVRTLSSGKNVTTESFEGAGTVARGGH